MKTKGGDATDPAYVIFDALLAPFSSFDTYGHNDVGSRILLRELSLYVNDPDGHSEFKTHPR